MNWTEIWEDLFGSASYLDIDIGFWVGIAAVCLIIIAMNVVFWCMKPKK